MERKLAQPNSQGQLEDTKRIVQVVKYLLPKLDQEREQEWWS